MAGESAGGKDRPRRVGVPQSAVSAGILLLLLGIGIWLVLEQRVFNPAVLVMLDQDAEPAELEGPAERPLAVLAPEGLAPLGVEERFDAQHLADKIDGRAELYLDAGFGGLRCQRFALVGEPDAWLELFLYQLGNPAQAFAVYSSSRRPERRQLDLAGCTARDASQR